MEKDFFAPLLPYNFKNLRTKKKKALLKKEILLIKVKNDCKDILKFFIDKIISIFNKYKESSTRVIRRLTMTGA